MAKRLLNQFGTLFLTFFCLFGFVDAQTASESRARLAERKGDEQNKAGKPAAVENGARVTAASDESAREDKFTGGRIERAALVPGGGNISITVDVPAFSLSLWQGDKEITRFHVGVGLKDFPISIGEQTADQIILNPDWIPPNSDWVREAKFKPYEPITAKDPRNPLGKIKIPLGYGYLLHQAKGVNDLGNLVSHGCVRILRRDLVDLSKKIAAAYKLPTADIDRSLTDKTQRVLTLGAALPVDINYDTMVVERGVLHIYPDVYDQELNTIENLRAELKENGVDNPKLTDATLGKVLARVTGKQQFVVALADVKANLTLTKGRLLPIVAAPKPRK